MTLLPHSIYCFVIYFFRLTSKYFYSQKIALEKELKQVHEDAAGLASRAKTMELRCMEAEMKYKTVNKIQIEATNALKQLQEERSTASSPRSKTPVSFF